MEYVTFDVSTIERSDEDILERLRSAGYERCGISHIIQGNKVMRILIVHDINADDETKISEILRSL